MTIISDSGDNISIGKINNGFYALFKMEGAVLGLSTDGQRDELRDQARAPIGEAVDAVDRPHADIAK